MFREPKKTNPRDPKDTASQTDGLDKKKVEPSLTHEKPLFWGRTSKVISFEVQTF